MTPKRIAVFLSSLLAGGAERVMLHLCGEMARRGFAVDLVLVRKVGPLLADVPPGVRVVELGTRSLPVTLLSLMRLPSATRRRLFAVLRTEQLPKVVRSLPLLTRYLERERPAALLVTLPNNVLVALWAAWLSHSGTPIIVREANTQSLNMDETTHLFERLFPAFANQWYPHASAVIAVSDGVADDLAQLIRLPRDRIATIYNPIDMARIAAGAAADVDDPWLAPGEPAVVIAVGRLYPQKDYGTLLRAFAAARRRRSMRLIVLGEGPERHGLQALATDLGIAEHIRLAGLIANPYAYMARADLLVLSSIWEGFPNVLLEALACGCPVVSTDCRSGPRELLCDGAYGGLVAVGDDAALADAMIATIDAPPPRQRLIQRAQAFALETIADAYLEQMLPNGKPSTVP